MKKCPACGKEYEGYPALSRKDNKTEICPTCGMGEALGDYMWSRQPKDSKKRVVIKEDVYE